jgi:hypothetical protein
MPVILLDLAIGLHKKKAESSGAVTAPESTVHFRTARPQKQNLFFSISCICTFLPI